MGLYQILEESPHTEGKLGECLTADPSGAIRDALFGSRDIAALQGLADAAVPGVQRLFDVACDPTQPITQRVAVVSTLLDEDEAPDLIRVHSHDPLELLEAVVMGLLLEGNAEVAADFIPTLLHRTEAQLE